VLSSFRGWIKYNINNNDVDLKPTDVKISTADLSIVVIPYFGVKSFKMILKTPCQ